MNKSALEYRIKDLEMANQSSMVGDIFAAFAAIAGAIYLYNLYGNREPLWIIALAVWALFFTYGSMVRSDRKQQIKDVKEVLKDDENVLEPRI